MPMLPQFRERLFPVLRKIVDYFETPFHIYDETGIIQNCKNMIDVFTNIPEFREYFAVKALPNPEILKIMKNMGFGFDCSSIPELVLSRQVKASGQDIIFTSNNTSQEEFLAAQADGGAILNLDDISLIDKVPQMPKLICFRYNPGEKRTGNAIIGNPVEAKYGVSNDQIVDAYKLAKKRGAELFGIHTMLASNELNYKYMLQTTAMLLEMVEYISEKLKITFEFIDIGGGLGIPYKPEDKPFDIKSLGSELTELFIKFKQKNNYMPKLFIESGRYMTGPHGVLITKAINHKNIYRNYIGVDACMSSLMRPGIYDAYHHITVLDKENAPNEIVTDVVGSLCENNDKFAIQRKLPKIEDNDILCIHDTGAHGHSMGFNYNGRLRPKELLLSKDGSVKMIRRQETIDDYFATLNFEPDILNI